MRARHALWGLFLTAAAGGFLPLGLGARDIVVREVALRHITMDKSQPADGETVSGVTEVRLFFSGEPLIRGASIRIVDSSRSPVPSTPPAADPADLKQLFVTMEAPLPVGTYVVQWRCIADDGHVMRGSFRFEVAAEA
jgi:methionine-rich copper-binding protein CopC